MGMLLAAFVAGMSCAAADVPDEVSDAATTARIETLFLLNEHLSPFNINTTTKGGEVTLTGSVRDDVQRDLAQELALSAPGCASVVNRITVVPTVVEERDRRGMRQRWEDMTTSASVRSRLLYHRKFRGLHIGVDTVNGVVTLHGVVRTSEQREAIGRVASETKGVDGVVNDLTVSPRKGLDPVQAITRQVSDEWTEGRVEAAIVLNKDLSIGQLRVEVNDGICILTGTVGSEAKRTLAGDVAGSIQGVEEVRNQIRVVNGEAPSGEAVRLEAAEEPVDAAAE